MSAGGRVLSRFARLLKMPKTSTPSFPASALFGIAKPSGPSSMSVINDLKRLVSASRLFMDEEVANMNAEKLYVAGDDDGGVGSKVNKKGGREKGKWKRMKKKAKEVEAKMGQGGTLDPLADGVLVVGVNKGTKKLGEFLDCIKEYRTTCLLGCETDSYDSEGAQVRSAPWRHVTRESVEAALEEFRGNILQRPPVFSALKMDGRPLYEYARKGIPLPRAIERRPTTVHSLELTHWIPGSEHTYESPSKKFTSEEREKLEKALLGTELPADTVIKDEPEKATATAVDDDKETREEKTDEADKATTNEKTDNRPPAFVLSMRVSGGTYVRSIAHDLGHALGSAAHVVSLTRSRQGRFVLAPSTTTSTPMLETAESDSAPAPAPATDASPEVAAAVAGAKPEEEVLKWDEVECVPWEVFARALENRATETPDGDGWREWEREMMQRLEIVES